MPVDCVSVKVPKVVTCWIVNESKVSERSFDCTLIVMGSYKESQGGVVLPVGVGTVSARRLIEGE